MSNILLRFKIFIVKKRYTLWKFPIFSPSSLILIFFGNKKEREREKEEVKIKIHRERTKDGIRVIFSRIKKKQWSKGLQRMAKKWREEVEVEMGQTSDDVFSREDVPLFSAKSNTGYATY